MLISGRTFSAAALLFGDPERHFHPVLVGELSDAARIHVGEDNITVLPNSGIVAMAASLLFVHSFSDHQREAIVPKPSVAPRFADQRGNRDPVLEAAIKTRERD